MQRFAADPYNRIRTRLPWLLIAALFVVGCVGAYSFLSSEHLSRLALEDYSSVEAQSVYFEVPPQKPMIASSVMDIVAILEPNNLITRRYDLPIVQTDDPEACLSAYQTGRVMDCFGMSLSAITMLEREGITTRLWNLTGTDGFGGDGHNAVEYYNQQAKRWEMIDPNYSCYFVKKGEESRTLDVATLRELLLTNPQSVDVRFYKSAVELRSAESLIEEFRSLVPTSSVYSTTDFRERYQTRYAHLMPMAGFIDQLPLSAKRGIRSFLMGASDRRLLIVDRYTPGYHLTLLKTLWYLSVMMFTLGLSLAFVRMLLHPRITLSRVRFARLLRRTAGFAQSPAR